VSPVFLPGIFLCRIFFFFVTRAAVRDGDASFGPESWGVMAGRGVKKVVIPVEPAAWGMTGGRGVKKVVIPVEPESCGVMRVRGIKKVFPKLILGVTIAGFGVGDELRWEGAGLRAREEVAALVLVLVLNSPEGEV
jgi:hypothetical protein